MTDYNDGKWHGWNGGECPVHEDSFVDLRWDDGAADNAVKAGRYDDACWAHDDISVALIIAFRVVKAYREPREFWAVGYVLRSTYADAEEFRRKLIAENPGMDWEPVIHVREVIE